MSTYRRARATRYDLGSFTLGSVLRVTDPCYTRGICEDTMPCRPGRYQAAVLIGEGSWGRRVMELEIVLVGADVIGPLHRTEIDAGVDSGQCGFFDDASYPQENTGEYDDLDSFYGQCCETSLHREHKAGIVPGFGVVSSSGFGDGCYEVWTDRDPKTGPIVFARLVFIDDERDDEDGDA